MAEAGKVSSSSAVDRAAALRRKLRSGSHASSEPARPTVIGDFSKSSGPKPLPVPKAVVAQETKPAREAPVVGSRPVSRRPSQTLSAVEATEKQGRPLSSLPPPEMKVASSTNPLRLSGRIEKLGSAAGSTRTRTTTSTPLQVKQLERGAAPHPHESEKSTHVSSSKQQKSKLSVSQQGLPKENRPTASAVKGTSRQDSHRGTEGTSHLLKALPAATTDVATRNRNDAQDDDSSTASSSDEESTAHDIPAPLIGAQEAMDASCLVNGSLVTVRACGSSTSLSVAAPPQDLAISPLATTALAGHTAAQQVFCLAKLFADPNNSATGDVVVRYGDTIALSCPFAKNRNLGVRKKSRVGICDESIYEVGFFDNAFGKPEQWTVLWGDTLSADSKKTAVAVGSRALVPRRRGSNNDQRPTVAARSVDLILLRNNATGGLLSFQESTGMTVVTHSYDSSDTVGTSLLARLQRNSRMIPRPSETFQLVHASVPACPQWVSGNRRYYLDGTYLLHPQRSESPFENGRIDRDGRSTQAQALSVQFQERALLDEVIGSMMGLEGTYIKSRMRGINDSRIVKDMQDVQFCVCDTEASIDTSLRNLVERILPLSTYYVRVAAFVSRHLPGYEYGTVMQAMCEGLDDLLQDYLGFCVKMEEAFRPSSQHLSVFTMNKLYVQVKPSLETMCILHHVIVVTRGLKGGALLNELRILMRKRFAGDDRGRRILTFLLDRASMPYMNMLSAWLETGVLQDPFGEFMVAPKRRRTECDTRKRSLMWVDYDGDDWEDLYHIREEHVLDGILSAPLTKQKILATGKGWNAVWYSRRTNRSREEEDDDALVLEDSLSSLSGNDQETISVLQYSMDTVTISSHIDRMYQSASRDLLQLILRDFRLIETLRTFRRFFLLDQGDFFVYFLDSAEEELLKEIAHVSKGRVQNWLNLSVQLTERHAEDTPGKSLMPGMHISLKKALPGYPLTASSLQCSFASESLEKHLDVLHAESGGIADHAPKTPSRHAYGISNKGLTGIEAFMLDFPLIPFPTSLVISQHAMGSYQLLFRHLFFAKHVERRLVGIWLDHQMMKELQSLRKALGPTYCLRQRMLHFMQNLIYYMMYEVIEPNWLQMEATVNGRANGTGQEETQQTVDDVRRVHGEFLHRTMEECLLTNRELIRTLTKLMNTCLYFSDQLKLFMEKTKICDENHDFAAEKRRKFRRNFASFDQSGTRQSQKSLRKLMVAARDERDNRIRTHAARVERELSNGSYRRMISRFEEVFNENLGDFMSALQSDSDGRHHVHRTNLCIRLDYNGYVTQSMGLN